MAFAREKGYTVKDIYALPDGTRAELIDGQIYYMAPPSRIHQKIVSELHAIIHDYISRHNGTCEIYPAPFAVFLNEDDRNYVEPDLSIICNSDKLSEKGCNGAPDWIIEIVSPASKQMDYYTKLFKYRSAGVRNYWIIDPDRQKITVWDFEAGSTADFTFSDSIAVGIYDDLTIDFPTLKVWS